MMANTWTIAARQFRSYFNGPIAYIVTIAVLGFVGVFFWRTFFLAGRATVSEMFFWFGLAMVVAAPALTMGLIAEERESGTIELLLTMPVREADVIIGKFLGALGLVTVIIVLSIVFPIAVSTLGNLDWGPVLTGYIGLVLQAAAMLAVGIMISSWTSNQLIAFFISLVTLAMFGWLIPLMQRYFVTGAWATFFDMVSLQGHLESMSRGVIDSRDVIFFLTLIVLGLMAAFRGLERRRWS